MKSTVSCDLCGAGSFHMLFTQKIDYKVPWSSFIGVESFPLRTGAKLCGCCGWLFLDPTYDEAELEKLYAADGSRLPPDGTTAVTTTDQQRCQAIRRTLEPWLPAGHLRLLDVGGGSGELVQCFAADGYEVTVVDMSNAPAIMPGMEKVSVPFLEWPGGEFDVILMSHVLEHTVSPSGFLEYAKSMMAKNGLLFVEVPFELLTPLIRRHIGDHRHLGFFSTVTLRGFLDKAGLECLTCRLTVGRVGDTVIPVIRAVARRRYDMIVISAWRPSAFMMARSLMTILNPLPWLIRGGNKFARLWR
jgi:SAM-dependent methyltransferase